jgi:hypothetical protein
MPEVIDKVLLEQPLTLQPNEGQGFGPVDVRGAERVNVMARIERADAKVLLMVQVNRRAMSSIVATQTCESGIAVASVPVFGPEVEVSVGNTADQPVVVRLVTLYAVR